MLIHVNETRLKLADLGTSCVLSKVESSQYAGTIEFTAPEVFSGKFGVEADIYSFGMTLLEMVSGEKPYSEVNDRNSIVGIKGRKELPEAIDRISNNELKEIILSCVGLPASRPSAKNLLSCDFFLNYDSSLEDSFVYYSKQGSNANLSVLSRISPKSHVRSQYDNKREESNQETVFSPFLNTKTNSNQASSVENKLRKTNTRNSTIFKDTTTKVHTNEITVISDYIVTFKMTISGRVGKKNMTLMFPFDLRVDTPEAIAKELREVEEINDREEEEMITELNYQSYFVISVLFEQRSQN